MEVMLEHRTTSGFRVPAAGRETETCNETHHPLADALCSNSAAITEPVGSPLTELCALGSGKWLCWVHQHGQAQPNAASPLLSITLTAGLSMSPLWGLFFFLIDETDSMLMQEERPLFRGAIQVQKKEEKKSVLKLIQVVFQQQHSINKIK